MKWLTLLAVAVGSIAAAFGSEIIITSPDHARTFAYGEMVWHQLYVDPTTHVLGARVTLSNLPYVGDNEPRVDEPFDFRFPGVHVDAAKRTLFARARRGNQITVASISRRANVRLDRSRAGSEDLSVKGKRPRHRHSHGDRSTPRGDALDPDGRQLVASESSGRTFWTIARPARVSTRALAYHLCLARRRVSSASAPINPECFRNQ